MIGHPASLMLFLLGSLGCTGQPAATPTVRDVLGEAPFLTPIDAPSTVAAASGTGSFPTTPSACGACHPGHLEEWAPSTHALAVHDAQFLAELAKPGQPRWLCMNCHAPTAIQRAEQIRLDTPFAEAGNTAVLKATPNPEHDASRTAEGIGCASCHVRRDADGLGTVVGPRGSGRAPHRVRTDPAALTSICERCHAPVDDPETYRVSPSLPCWFTTREELAAGPQAAQSCVDCHMPELERSAALGAPVVTLKRHGWAGGGVPKNAEGYSSLVARGWALGLTVDVSAQPLAVTLLNAAGHAVPTADPERFLLVEVRAEDDAGTALGSDTLRLGQTWDFGDGTAARPAHRVADDRLQAGATRRWEPALVVPTAATRLVVSIRHVRVNEHNAAALDATVLDAELAALWPDFPAELRKAYPRMSQVYRETVDLRTGARTLASAEQLAADSLADLAAGR